MTETELTTLLRENADFSRVSDAALAALIQSGERRITDPGEELIRQGESGERIWVLIAGELEALVDTDRGRAVLADLDAALAQQAELWSQQYELLAVKPTV